MFPSSWDCCINDVIDSSITKSKKESSQKCQILVRGTQNATNYTGSIFNFPGNICINPNIYLIQNWSVSLPKKWFLVQQTVIFWTSMSHLYDNTILKLLLLVEVILTRKLTFSQQVYFYVTTFNHSPSDLHEMSFYSFKKNVFKLYRKLAELYFIII